MNDRAAKYFLAGFNLSRLAISFLCLSGMLAIGLGIWRLRAPVNKDGMIKSAAMASLVDSGQSLCEDLGRIVQPAIKRTQLLAADPQIIASILSRDKPLQTQACNAAITRSTEIDAVALFDSQGRITAINSVYASGKPIEQTRLQKILNSNFGNRSIIQRCIHNDYHQQILEFQTTCDITPALFDSTGLSVAYSVPVYDPKTQQEIGVVSSRLRFERLTDLIRNRAIGGTKGSTQFVTDKGGYFSEEINSGRQPAPVSPKVLAGVVLPLVQGNSDYCFTQQGNDYLCLFKLKGFTTLAGGGIQVMVVADEAWLMRELRQAQFLNCGVLISLGLFLLLCAVYLRSATSLRQSQKWNQLLINTTLEAIIAVDEHRLVKTWNPQAQRTFGFTAKEALGNPIHTLIPLPDHFDVLLNQESSLEASAPSVSGKRVELHTRRKDGSRITIDLVVIPARVGQFNWKCIFSRDVTEQRDTEMHLAQSQKLESIGQLAAGIAHEINTPTQYVGDNIRFVRDSFVRVMAAMQQQYQLLGTQDGPRPWTERQVQAQKLRDELDLEFLQVEIPSALNQSIDGLQGIAKIVGAMKEFSHPGGQTKEAADLNAAIESTTIVCQNRWRSVAELELELDHALPHVPVLLGEFNQVMLNLIVNAADAIAETSADTGQKGKIRVVTKLLGDKVEIRVQDDGPGMGPEVATKIFDPFFTTKPVGKGTGQGLTLSRNVIVKKHGGSLGFESKPGSGTTFIIQLPVCDPQATLLEAA